MAPVDCAVYWHANETKTGTQQTVISSRPPEESLIDTKITYDLPALVDLALHANTETIASFEEAQAAAAGLERI
ncbi:MAG: TolC family protein, partial [Methylococcaceae bacterium]|nr:TolC family protein [Methylococcaceae bacterium]